MIARAMFRYIITYSQKSVFGAARSNIIAIIRQATIMRLDDSYRQRAWGPNVGFQLRYSIKNMARSVTDTDIGMPDGRISAWRGGETTVRSIYQSAHGQCPLFPNATSALIAGSEQIGWSRVKE